MAAAPTEAVVQPGDTVYTVASRYDISVRGLIEANGLTAPYRVTAGQKLRLPSEARHVVARGETVASIARQYGVDQNEIIRVNGLQAPYTIQVGRNLKIPRTDVAAQPMGGDAAAPSLPASPVAPVTRAPVGGSGVQVESLAPPGGGSSAPAGQAPSIAPAAPASQASPPAPMTQGASATQAAALPQAVQPAVRPAAPSSGAPPPPAAEDLLPPESPPRALDLGSEADAPEMVAVAPTPKVAGAGFAWPVKGEVISTYGVKDKGLFNDGINIAAPQGTPVMAAEKGVVVYAGNELRGFGNLVLVKHEGGWVTAYAHNDQVLVKRGDHVEKGQRIAKVGSTGSVQSPQLHFELRRGKTPVDPTPYLSGNQA